MVGRDSRESPLRRLTSIGSRPASTMRGVRFHEQVGTSRYVHREFNFACLAAVHGDGGVGSLIGDRLRVVAVLGLVKRHDGEA
jgi:hypothetical protein